MSATSPPDEFVESTTELAVQEKKKLVKSLRRLDMIGFTVCAFVGLDTLGTVASNGAQGFTWLVVLSLVFVAPFALLFIWISIGVAIVSLRRGKWIPNFGAFLRVFVMAFFTLTTIIYAIKHGAAGFHAGDLKPTGVIFLALVPLLLFNYVGFELQNGAAEEMENPHRDVPLSVLRSGVLGVLL